MLVLKSQFGTFILDNALKIDCYTTLEKTATGGDVLHCHLAIDQYKYILTSFEDEMDAALFCKFIIDNIATSLASVYAYSPLDLSDVIIDAMEFVIEKGEV